MQFCSYLKLKRDFCISVSVVVPKVVADCVSAAAVNWAPRLSLTGVRRTKSKFIKLTDEELIST